jgi:hypothetical protein
MVSLAVMWRLPVIHARDPEDALVTTVARRECRLEPGLANEEVLSHLRPR